MDDYRPSDLGLLNQTATTIDLYWSVSTCIQSDIDHFDIRYHPVGEIKWKTIETDHNKNSFLITELKSETRYEFKVRSVLPDGNESPFSDPSVFKTMASLTEHMKKEGTKLSGNSIPTLYKIPLDQVASQKRTKTRKIKLRTSKQDLDKDDWLTESKQNLNLITLTRNCSDKRPILYNIRAVAGQRSSPESGWTMKCRSM